MTPTLNHIQCAQLDPTTWCATAQVSEPIFPNLEELKKEWLWTLACFQSPIKLHEFNWHYCGSSITLSMRERAHNQRQLQRRGVRLLLQHLLSELKISDTLNESHFPYRLINSQYYVCFSHTSTHNKNAIIDIAGQTIDKPAGSNVAVVISRHRPAGIDIENNNIAWKVARRFYSNDEITAIQLLPITQRDIIAKLLWQIKESFIKIYQYKLAEGLGISYAYIIAELISSINKQADSIIISDSQSSYRITVLFTQQTVVVS